MLLQEIEFYCMLCSRFHLVSTLFPFWVISQPKVDGFCSNMGHFKGWILLGHPDTVQYWKQNMIQSLYQYLYRRAVISVLLATLLCIMIWNKPHSLCNAGCHLRPKSACYLGALPVHLTLVFTCGEAYRSRRALDSVQRHQPSFHHSLLCGSG